MKSLVKPYFPGGRGIGGALTNVYPNKNGTFHCKGSASVDVIVLNSKLYSMFLDIEKTLMGINFQTNLWMYLKKIFSLSYSFWKSYEWILWAYNLLQFINLNVLGILGTRDPSLTKPTILWDNLARREKVTVLLTGFQPTRLLRKKIVTNFSNHLYIMWDTSI